MSAPTSASSGVAPEASRQPAADPGPGDHAAAGRPRRGWLRRALGWGIGLLAGLLGMGLLLGLFVLGTQTGLRALLAVVDEVAPGMVAVSRVEGRVLGRLELDELALRLPGLELEAGRLLLDWRPGALLTGTLRVATLRAQDLSVLTEPAAEKAPSEPFALPSFRLPIAIELEQALIERLVYNQLGAPPAAAIRLTRAELVARADRETLALETFEATLSQPHGQLQAAGRLGLDEAYPVDLRLAWRFRQAPALQLEGAGAISGDLDELRIQHRLSGSVAATVQARLQEVLTQPSWTAEIVLEAVDLPAMVADAPALALRAELKSEGDLQRAALTGTLRGETPAVAEVGRLAADLDVEWAEQVLRIHSLRLTESSASTSPSANGAQAPEAAPLAAQLDLTGRLDTRPAVPVFEVQAEWERLRWPLVGEPLAELPQGALEAEGDLAGYGYRLTSALYGRALPETEVALTGTGDREQTRVSELRIGVLNGRINAKGLLAWAPAPAWDLAITAQGIDPGLQWPGLDGQVELKAETRGDLEQGYQLEIAGNAAFDDYPPVQIDLAGHGDAESAVIESLRAEVIDGHLEARGTLSWAPALGWDAELELEDLDPGQVLADWPGRLGGQVTSTGASDTAGLQLNARINDFGGQLRGYPVRLQAALGMQGEALTLERLEASSGETRLVASGRADSTLDFRYDFRSPSLTALAPELQGQLSAAGTLAGTRKAPRVTLALQGRDIELAQQGGLERIAASADVGLGADAPLQLDLTISDLFAAGQRFESLAVRGQGSLRAHRLSADLEGDWLSLAAAAEGGLQEDGGYQGQLAQLDLETADYGRWGLQRPAPYRLAGAALDVGPLCLGDAGTSRGCVAFQQPEAGRFLATLDLERLGFELLAALTPETIAPAGYLSGTARFEGRGELLTGTARMGVPEGAIEILLPQASQTLVFSNARLDVRADAEGLNAQFELPVEDTGRIAAEVGLPGFRLTAAERQPLRGQVRIDLDGLDRLAALAPDLQAVQGAVAGALTLNGTLAQPDIRGELSVREVALTVPTIGLELAELNLNARSEGASRMRIDGGAAIGGGRLELDGALAGLDGREPSLEIKLSGEQLKVADTNEYLAVLSLDLEAGFGLGGGAVRGEVRVPQARISPRTVPAGTVQPSPDVVLGEQPAQKEGLPFSVDVLAKLGTDVSVEAFGLRGQLRGQLRVTQQPGGMLRGDGELQVIDGTYRVALPGLGILTSVGKPLVIEKGIVVYAKTPLDNPGIILNAQREGGDMTAGVRVLGTLRNPKLAFFSESDPNMTQSEITSYLVTGIPPKRGAEADERSISVGTYIAPKLFMEYDSNLGDKSDSIKMRYDLTERIQVQSETGDAQGVDLFYKFEN